MHVWRAQGVGVTPSVCACHVLRGGAECCYLCVRCAFFVASAVGEGLRRRRGCASAAMLARNSAACSAASLAASELVRLGEGERELSLPRSRTCCESVGACDGLGEDGGERERAV
jgi:hypothetical protein